jgi:hypothetical protein
MKLRVSCVYVLLILLNRYELSIWILEDYGTSK